MSAASRAPWLGLRTIELATCESTNDEAARLAANGAAHGTVVTALRQARGRGRQGRVWQAPASEGVFWSCVLRPALAPAAAAGLTLAAGVAACEAVRACGVAATLKWPNDVVVVDAGVVAKLGGILTESVTRGSALEYVVVGIGLNVTNAPVVEGARTTSIHQAGGRGSRAEVVARLRGSLEQWLDRYLEEGMAAISPTWQAMAERRCELRVGTGQAARVAELVGLADDGALMVAIDGVTTTIRAGEVELGRVTALGDATPLP
ncbi:MAG: biotin--[acetyl-CoA-carboxylase] ligase [Myxococcales bacterium]|nr:biotin--[acetyl-CoA-carboxylase] ligase [Myxococcales bacterium]